MSDIWEPWRPEIGQRVKIRLSAECQVRAFSASPPPGVSDDDLREMMRARVDVANRYAHDEWRDGHPEWLDGSEGTVTDVNRAMDYGHYYRVMFDEAVGPDSYVGIDLAAIELEPIQ